MASNSMTGHWDKDKILTMIEYLKGGRKDLSYNSVARENQDLISAANYHFGSWREAVVAAGIDYENEVRKKPKWSTDKVIRTIQEAHEAGVDLSWSSIVNNGDYSGMAYAAIRPRCFGSWDNALHASGIDPKSVRRYQSWDSEKVIEQITERKEKNLALNSKQMQIEDSKLFNAALKRFGSWDKALEAAGIDAVKVYKRRRWNKKLIKAEIQFLSAMGYDLAAPAMRKNFCGLYSAGCKYFGSWTAARRAAGIRRSYRRGRKALSKKGTNS